MRYIDAENIGTLFDEEYKSTLELIKQGETHLDSLAEGFTEAHDIVERIPTADVRPVVRGEWIGVNDGYDCYCSICHSFIGCEYDYVTSERGEWDFRFCGHCGADMRQEASND